MSDYAPFLNSQLYWKMATVLLKEGREENQQYKILAVYQGSSSRAPSITFIQGVLGLWIGSDLGIKWRKGHCSLIWLSQSNLCSLDLELSHLYRSSNTVVFCSSISLQGHQRSTSQHRISIGQNILITALALPSITETMTILSLAIKCCHLVPVPWDPIIPIEFRESQFYGSNSYCNFWSQRRVTTELFKDAEASFTNLIFTGMVKSISPGFPWRWVGKTNVINAL